MRDLSGTGQVYRFTLSQLLKSRANRVTLIIMVLLAAVSMPLQRNQHRALRPPEY